MSAIRNIYWCILILNSTSTVRGIILYTEYILQERCSSVFYSIKISMPDYDAVIARAGTAQAKLNKTRRSRASLFLFSTYIHTYLVPNYKTSYRANHTRVNCKFKFSSANYFHIITRRRCMLLYSVDTSSHR